MKTRSWLLWAAIVLITVLPLYLNSAPAGSEGLFGGSDDRAQKAIGSLAPGYQPWFSPVLAPASSEIASLLFALQAAIGAGVIGYWLGLSVARERARKMDASTQDPHAD
jgi:cobalt/nickel transport protein